MAIQQEIIAKDAAQKRGQVISEGIQQYKTAGEIEDDMHGLFLWLDTGWGKIVYGTF